MFAKEPDIPGASLRFLPFRLAIHSR